MASLAAAQSPGTAIASNCTDTTGALVSWYDQQLGQLTCQLRAASDVLPSGDPLHSANPVHSAALLAQIYSLHQQVSDRELLAEAIEAGKRNPDPVVRGFATGIGNALSNRCGTSETHITAPPELLTAAAARRGDAAAVDLAMLERTAQVRPAKAGIEALVTRAPSAQAWMLLADASSEPAEQLRAANQAVALEPGFVPATLLVARIYAARNQPLRARDVLDAGLQLHPSEPVLRKTRADLDLSSGSVASALAVYQELARLPRKSAELTADLAERLSESGLIAPAQALARAALDSGAGANTHDLLLRLDERAMDAAMLQRDKAICPDLGDDATPSTTRKAGQNANQAVGPADLAPADESAARIRRLLSQGPEAKVEMEPVRRPWFVNADEALRRWRTRRNPAGGSRVLANVRVVRLRAGYLAESDAQRVIVTTTAADAGRLSRVSVPYSPDTEQLTILRATLLKADGSAREAEEAGEAPLSDPATGMYFDRRVRTLVFAGMEAGDAIALEYSVRPIVRENPFGRYYADVALFGSDLPTDVERFVVTSPASLPLYAEGEHLPSPEVRKMAGEITRVWESRDLPAISRETNAPGWLELAGHVHVSSFNSWPELGKWYAGLVRPQLLLNSELETAAQAIAREHSGERERVRAVLDFVVRNTHYVALEFGIFGFQPHAVADTYAKRYGDCKDKASLMIALLRAMDIEGRLALLRTQGMGDIATRPASVSIFDHAIVYLPTMNLWVDPTADFAKVGELPVEDQGALAFTVALDGTSQMLRVPRSTAEENHWVRSVAAELRADGELLFTGSAKVSGEDAPGLRRDCESRSERVSCVRGRMAEVFPAIEIHRADWGVDWNGTGRDGVALQFDGALKSFAGKHQIALPSSWIARPYLAALAPQRERAQDLLLYAPWTTEEKITVQLPSGALARAPEDKELVSEFGRLRISYQLADDKLEIHSNVEFSGFRVTATQYASFRRFVQEVDRAFRQQITIEMP